MLTRGASRGFVRPAAVRRRHCSLFSVVVAAVELLCRQVQHAAAADFNQTTPEGASFVGETTSPSALRTTTAATRFSFEFVSNSQHEHFWVFWGCICGAAILFAAIVAVWATFGKGCRRKAVTQDPLKVDIEMVTCTRQASPLEFNEAAKAGKNEPFRL
jgi:hypothetical protein